MEITNANAGILLPHITAQLRDCAFFAVDLEFTGIDRDGADAGATTPEALAESLMRKPSDLYPKKLEALKPYSIIQIGLSIFSRCSEKSGKSSADAASRVPEEAALRPSAEELSADVKDFVPDARDTTYYTNCIARVLEVFDNAAGDARAAGSTSGWAAAMMFVSEEKLRVGQQVATSTSTADSVTGSEPAAFSPSNSVDASFATTSVVELMRRYHFLEALFGAIGRRSRESEHVSRVNTAGVQPSTEAPASPQTPPAPPMESYRVQTFTAYMFPAVLDEAQNISLNVDTAEFLVKNNIDLVRWIKEGLRFKPFPSVAAALAADAAKALKDVEQLSQPHKALPHFTERFKSKLDELLPFTSAELQLVKFVLDLCEGPLTPATSHIVPFYIGATKLLILYGRGQLSESALPESIYVKDKVFRDEMAALAGLGITKMNRRYTRMTSFGSAGAATNNNGSNNNGGGGGGNNVGPSLSGDGALTASAAAQGYGTALFEAVLHATEALRKPIVFYNGYTDLLFLLLSFYGPQSMPPTLAAFKALVHRHFPVLYDTRVLTCAGPLQSLGNFTGRLSSVVEEMAKVPTVSPYVSFQFDGLVAGGDNPALSAAAHNAGFDAMLTGKLFAYTTHAIAYAGGSYELYENFLATYNTLLSINLTEKDDGVLQEEPTPIYFLADSCGLRVDSIRDALHKAGLTALVMYRGSGYTIQPVGSACRQANYRRQAEDLLSRQAHSTITLVHIDI